MTDCCMVFVTVPDQEHGQRIANLLVSEKLCACASLSEGYTSVFIWKACLETTSETLMIIKTHSSKIVKLETRIRELHPYEVFEFLAVPVLYGNAAYLNWVKESVI